MTMITPSYLGETIEYSSLHACRSTLEDPTHYKWMTSETRTHSYRTLRTSRKKRISYFVGAFTRFSPPGEDGWGNIKGNCKLN